MSKIERNMISGGIKAKASRKFKMLATGKKDAEIFWQ